jgi:hypothetical protein
VFRGNGLELMTEIPNDPVQDLINKATFWGKKIGLSLINEDVIILPRDKDNPNEIVAIGIGYEHLESDPTNSPRWIAQQLSLCIQSTRKQVSPWLLNKRKHPRLVGSVLLVINDARRRHNKKGSSGSQRTAIRRVQDSHPY